MHAPKTRNSKRKKRKKRWQPGRQCRRNETLSDYEANQLAVLAIPCMRAHPCGVFLLGISFARTQSVIPWNDAYLLRFWKLYCMPVACLQFGGEKKIHLGQDVGRSVRYPTDGPNSPPPLLSVNALPLTPFTKLNRFLPLESLALSCT